MEVAWEKKAGQCFLVRSRMWRDFLQEYRENSQDNAERFGYEVRLRTMLELLKTEYQQQSAEVELLSGLDSYLSSVLEPSRFIGSLEYRMLFQQANTGSCTVSYHHG